VAAAHIARTQEARVIEFILLSPRTVRDHGTSAYIARAARLITASVTSIISEVPVPD